MKRFDRPCACCGSVFAAGNLAARFCSETCRGRAYRRRRRGAPEADEQLTQQLAIVEDDCDLPEAWSLPPVGTEQRFWHGTAIQRRKVDGFVNATAMCQSNGRLWAKYRETERCQSYLEALSKMSEIRMFDLIQSQRGRTGGTWVHPSIAIDLARWISPAFAVWMDGWFLESITKPQQAQPRLTPGIHIVADTMRDAHRLWSAALRSELIALMDGSNHDLLGTTNLPAARFAYHVGGVS